MSVSWVLEHQLVLGCVRLQHRRHCGFRFPNTVQAGSPRHTWTVGLTVQQGEGLSPEHTALLGMAGPGKASLPLLPQASTHTHTQSCSRKCTLIDSLFLSLHTHTHTLHSCSQKPQ